MRPCSAGRERIGPGSPVPTASRRHSTMRIGVLTAGGDCPGLNAVIRSVVHRAVDHYGDEVIGFEDGYSGLLDGRYRALDLDSVSGILARGGTILGSSRLERDRLREACESASDMIHEFGIDALIPIGGRAPSRPRACCSTPVSRSSAFRRRSTTTSPPPTAPSASTPRS